ncbi:hypothetical protein BH10CHL1_BH10CHL1_39900 [soil metagenome]
MSTNQQTSYQSYLLRLWRSGPHSAWHGSLQNTADGEKHAFADLAALVAFLVGQLAEDDAALVLADLVVNLQVVDQGHTRSG